MSIIKKLEAKEILDSRGNPTISVMCTLESGLQGSASVPSGASTGAHEAYELRDGIVTQSNGKGVQKAIKNINEEIYNLIINKEINQESLDRNLIKLDGTKNKSHLGANAILPVSLAFARAQSLEKGVELFKHLADLYFTNKEKINYKIPEPAFNIINGGKHSKSGLSFQEFMLIPVGIKTMERKIETVSKITTSLQKLLTMDNQSTEMGDEGGFAPKLKSNEEAFIYLERAITSAGYDTKDIKLGVDVAASTFLKNEQYVLEGKTLNPKEMIQMYVEYCTHHEIISIEDGLSEEDFDGFSQMNETLGEKINIVGDDLTVTNIELIKKAIEHKSINTLLVKPNQIGTLTETLEAIKIARDNGIKIFVSHRSGETLDTFIADLAVAVGADYIKAGAPTKEERMVKYHRLIEIEKNLSTS